ncbi:GNAT family N-acetyltransferase [Haladaptatus sp. AB643]|uniref:GNAT family N-acetyltransferase n=1 Tax=Haladaptatus sp. AB643 TaxID=2934174 RepID=UPI00209C170C|nr:GNAT family N-acetyltransferase [Haladaptatus sp. AB643]MCO8244175.1 GNAT family N-acetyltransferase [Haladaptatus sp. AB643]
MSVLNRVEDEYVVRWYKPSDLSGFLSLDRAVFHRRRNEAWFRWKYVDNPYVDHVPVLVVEKDGEIVGARPFLAFRMRVGSGTVLALQPADTMVHPDHRRQGLFTRMTSHAIDHYGDGEPAFFFNFPNQRSRPGYLKLGWQIVGDRETYHRIQNPTAFLGDEDGVGSGFLDYVLPLTNDVHGLYRSAVGDSEAFSIARRSGVEAGVLADLYATNPPEAIHALRDETFYRWRFSSPEWERTTYVASDSGDPVAGIVVRKRTTSDGVTVVQLADAVPMVGGDSRDNAFVALLARIVRDYADADLVSVTNGTIPPEVLIRFGFVGDAGPPLSWLSDFDCRLVALPLDDDGWSVGGTRLGLRSNWHISFAERDTA